LKYLKTYADKCIGCGKCMEKCASTYFKENNENFSRIKVSVMGGLPNINVCNQCGACINVCPVEALYRDKNGVVRLDNKKCTSCLMCVGFCPTASMFFDADAQPQPFKCIACGLCATVCPTGALELQNS